MTARWVDTRHITRMPSVARAASQGRLACVNVELQGARSAKAIPSCDLFIRTYRKDFDWLRLCLVSISKFCHGFGSVIVIVPRSSRGWLARLPRLDKNVHVELCPDYPDDYLGQQVTKLFADTFSTADFLCHVDVDCIFQHDVSPSDFIVGDKPIVAFRRFEELGRHWPWRTPASRFLGWDLEHDYMQQPPFTYPRWLYARVRAHALSVHGMDIARYVLSMQPRGFSEFNVLGGYSWARYQDRFVWVHADDSGDVQPHCRWYWSWGGIDRETRAEIETLLGSNT